MSITSFIALPQISSTDTSIPVKLERGFKGVVVVHAGEWILIRDVHKDHITITRSVMDSCDASGHSAGYWAAVGRVHNP